MITRYLSQQLGEYLKEKKIIILYGPRQAGKTTLVKEIAKTFERTLYITGDIPRQVQRLLSKDDRIYAQYLAGIQLLVIDEAQHISDIGVILKILFDVFGDTCRVIATGSSSFELAQKTQEPLTGRKTTLTLLPIGIHELFSSNISNFQRDTLLPDALLYGMYPEIYMEPQKTKKREKLTELVDAYLFKDILQFEGIKKSETIIKLAKMLAYQIGKPVSTSELSNKLGISLFTVDKYLTILEQAFVIFRIGSYTKNLKKELSKGQKFYFWDVGIRNSLIEMFADIDIRPDKGELRENFIIAEMMKKKMHTRMFGKYYFWRTYDDQEIDLIYNLDDTLTAFEIKRSRVGAKIPKIFLETYQEADTYILTQENALELVCSD